MPAFLFLQITSLRSQINSLMGPGTIIPFAGPISPPGFLVCDGSAVSRTTYSALFNVIGGSYGNGDGSSTFNLPDLRGRVPMGSGGGPSLTSRALGQQLGKENHQLSGQELAAHSHGVNDNGHGHGVNDPQHTHGEAWLGCDNGCGGDWGFVGITDGIRHNYAAYSTYPSGTGISIQSGWTGISIQNTGTGITIQYSGSNSAHNNIQPSTVISYVIRSCWQLGFQGQVHVGPAL